LHSRGKINSTLVLVNGQRLAASEGSGAVDVTLIPLSAVESIDITTGSASAMYGSDAVAGVVDITLRKDLNGFEVTAALGTATEGGSGLQHCSVAAGHKGDVAEAFAVADCE
jgi:iron complex outermembrane recepter protein